MHKWLTNIWQGSQEYSMGKEQSLQHRVLGHWIATYNRMKLDPYLTSDTDSLYNRIISKCTVKNLIFMNNNGILLNKTMGELFRETVYINWGKRDKEKVISIFCPFLSILIPFRYSWKKWSRAKHMQKWKVGARQKVIIQ